MEEPDPEWQVGVGPERMIGAEAQRVVLVPGKLGQLRRALVAGRLERLRRELTGLRLELVPVEGLARAESWLSHQAVCSAEHAGEQPPAADGGGAFEKITSVHACAQDSPCCVPGEAQRTTRAPSR